MYQYVQEKLNWVSDTSLRGVRGEDGDAKLSLVGVNIGESTCIKKFEMMSKLGFMPSEVIG